MLAVLSTKPSRGSTDPTNDGGIGIGIGIGTL
jgi:hypothetical protein